MKADIQVLVARFKGVAISYEGINDCYTTVQLCVKKCDLDDETIDILHNTRYVYESDTGFNLGENEAKDYQSNYGKDLTVQIETVSIEL